ncbi:SRPBCC domain-containing protein [Phytoactinopolyspora limicola]|uniref:SRPBCC domain-containing protein n=1 Tax=Phytoactinopolyspora limicola TaxID=2715536 RepID=UPI00140B796B|nr:SRPBCC domain-containing protein [Phytoactinopolyspora limicola]
MWTRILLIALGSLVVIGAGLYTWTRISPGQIHTEIEIDATPDEVWEVLTDLDDYPAWNPFIVSAEGAVEVGERLVNELLMSHGNSTMTIKPTITVADPGREFRWLGRFVVPGIIDGEHYFVLEPTPDGGTRMIHGEKFTGILVPFAGSALDVTDNFVAMNEALKARVEGTH